jgi:hypothetical protein
MDVETTEAINGLRGDMQRMDADMQRMDATVQGFEAALREGLAENRRFTQILAESLRDDIRIVAEGLVALDAKLDARIGSLEGKIDVLDVRTLALDAKVTALDARVTRIEIRLSGRRRKMM